MRKALGLFMGVACALSLAACAAKEKPAQPTATTQPIGGTVGENLVTATATVEAIDLKKRLLTLRGPLGNVETVEVDKAVKNLPQVKKGDKVVATYYQSLAYEVKQPGQAVPGVTAAGQLETAKPGQMPAGIGARALTITAAIEAIDRTAPSVTLKGPEGKLVTIKVRDPKKLEGVNVGDLVEITYTQALAVSVEPATK
jgi:hypothetical protein